MFALHFLVAINISLQQKYSLKSRSFSAAPVNLIMSWGGFAVFGAWLNLENNKTVVRVSESGLSCFNLVKCSYVIYKNLMES